MIHASSPHGQAIRLLRAIGGRLARSLAASSCVWAPEVSAMVIIERRNRHGEPPEGHPEVLCPEVPLSAIELDLWSRLNAD